jgi:3-methyladenine DNA glycosylase AlkD
MAQRPGSAALDPKAAVSGIRSCLAKERSAARAAGAQRYLKSNLQFLGVTVPTLRREAKAFSKAHPALDAADLRALAEALWKSDVHELRSFAIGVLEQRVPALSGADLPWLLAFINNADTWAHVDWLAIKVIGAVITREPRLERTLSRWIKHPNFWVRRTALLALHDSLQAGEGNFDCFAKLATALLGDQEFFIRKAIGWVLRATAKRRPELTFEFVQQHAQALSSLSFKEATRNLAPSQQKQLQALRQGTHKPTPRKPAQNR